MTEEAEKSTILVVDDTKANIDVLVNILKKGYDINVSLSGENALELVESEMPDLILLDIVMPDMDGYEVCRLLKANPKTKDIPVIFVTSLNQQEDETRGLELGAVDYITKPISPSIVRARVKNHLELTKSRQKLAKQNKELLEAAQLKEDVERITRHDLKTPLNAIIGFPDLILDDNLNPTQIEQLQMIEEAGFRMLDMINLSLDLFKMEQKIYTPIPVPVDLLPLITKIEKELVVLIRYKNLAIKRLINHQSVVEGDTFEVQGEYLLCYSLLANLIKNAVEASPKNENLDIHFETNATSKISIQNKGVVAPEIRDHFFEKYVTSGKNEGTGLGTYSARLITETLGGKISLNVRNPDQTIIQVELPATR